MNQYPYNYIGNNIKDWGDHMGLVEFCYNSTKHSTTKINPFELALGVEAKQPIYLTILRTRGICHKGGKETKDMAEDNKENKS